MKKKYIFPI